MSTRQRRRVSATLPASLRPRAPQSGGYDRLVLNIGELLEQARRTTARSVNSILTATYWEIGRRIVEASAEADRFAGGERHEFMVARLREIERTASTL